MEFDFKRRSRTCSISEHDLTAGESYYSVIVENEGEIQRSDICLGEWNGPPENCIGWWKSKIPDADPNRYFWAPDDVIIDAFESFKDNESRLVHRYLLSLLLIQKRVFRIQDSNVEGTDRMTVSCNKRGEEYEVVVVDPGEALEDIQEELSELLFSDEPFDSEDLDELATDENQK